MRREFSGNGRKGRRDNEDENRGRFRAGNANTRLKHHVIDSLDNHASRETSERDVRASIAYVCYIRSRSRCVLRSPQNDPLRTQRRRIHLKSLPELADIPNDANEARYLLLWQQEAVYVIYKGSSSTTEQHKTTE